MLPSHGETDAAKIQYRKESADSKPELIVHHQMEIVPHRADPIKRRLPDESCWLPDAISISDHLDKSPEWSHLAPTHVGCFIIEVTVAVHQCRRRIEDEPRN